MSENKPKPTRWYYLLALLLPIFACAGTATFVYGIIPKLPGALNALDIKHLTQVVVPGAAEIKFQEQGAYAVYYEYRTDFNGVRYSRSEYPPNISCQLKSISTGKSIRLDSSSVEGNVYSVHNPKRAGVLFKHISIDQPGVYTFSCKYPDGRTYPKSVMAIGPNLVLEFFNIAAKPIAAIFFGSIAFAFSCGISILIIGFVAFKRHRSKNIL